MRPVRGWGPGLTDMQPEGLNRVFDFLFSSHVSAWRVHSGVQRRLPSIFAVLLRAWLARLLDAYSG